MIVRRNLKLSIVFRRAWKLVLYASLLACVVPGIHEVHAKLVELPFSAVAMLATALALFLGFRNNSAYDRWWEARKAWGTLVNLSRSFGRQTTAFIQASPEVHRELLHRHLAFVHLLRLHLRRQPELRREALAPFLAPEELESVLSAGHGPNRLLHRQGQRLMELHRAGAMDGFHHLSIEALVAQATDVLGVCERIKNTPLPRQYDYFPRVFFWVFVTYLPFGLVRELGPATGILTVPISFFFYALEGVGEVNENPFENSLADTPMTALCRTIEISMREQLGESPLPKPLEPVDGYLM